MVAEAWDDTAKVSFDKAMWAELTTLRFVEDAANALVLGPVGVGKTFLASALGHIACRRRFSVHFERADRLHKRLKATRLDASHDAEMRKLMRVDVLILDLSRPRDYPDPHVGRVEEPVVGSRPWARPRVSEVGIIPA
jgi:DNA replication protein DnaC